MTAEVALAGTHKLQIDYREITGTANLSLRWQDVRTVGLTPTPTPTPAPAVPTGLTATVNAAVLNVRSEPSINGVILTKITRNQVYSVVGRNADSTWFQLDVNGQRGWASGAFLTVSDADTVTVVDTAPISVNPNDVLVRNSVRLNFRSGPATSFESLAVIPARTTLKVIGRNGDSSWLRVEYDGRQGWVVLNFVQAVTDLNFTTIPVSE
ncbi:MAG: SH3 domain-containing protein [Anaerolineae bacterium]|nr:SH3 domain-containing protein [Anaerolineae bacterium]